MYPMETLATPAAILEIKAKGDFASGAFAVRAKEVGRAFAHPTVVGSSPAALRRELFVILAVSGRPWVGPQSLVVLRPACLNHIARV